MYLTEVERPPHGLYYWYYNYYRFKPQDTYDEAWYRRMRTQGARTVSQYIRLQPDVAQESNSIWQVLPYAVHQHEILSLP